MDYEAEIRNLQSQIRDLQRIVAERELIDSTIPKTTAPYDSGSVASADGVIPMLIDGTRYDVLVNET